MKKLRIAMIAPLWVPVPPFTYGGTELMVSNLTEELVKRGHDVTLFASGDSRTSARLIPITEQAVWRMHIRNVHAPIMRLVKEVHDRFANFDIIHNHFAFFPFPLTLMANCPPMVTTIHRPIDKAFAETINAYPMIKYVSISKDHRQSSEDFGVTPDEVIYNGIDVKRHQFNNKPQDYLLYVGRLNEEKGILHAIEVAKKTGRTIVVAGNTVGPQESLFYIQHLQPLLHLDNVKFRGPVNFEEKIELMKNASALLCPIEVREAFGLVMAEAMACGTPVIGFKHGSVPELVKHGVTGFVVKDVNSMARAVSKLDTIDRKACRERVEKHFSIEAMVEGYEKLYSKTLGG